MIFVVYTTTKEFLEKESKMKKSMWICLAALGLSGCGKQEISLISNQIELELGTELETTVESYVKLDEEDAEEASLDFSEVDVMAVGTYRAHIIYNGKKLSFEVVVKDTTAPEVAVEENIVAAVNEPLYAEDIMTGVTELSGEVKISFQKPDTMEEDITEGSKAAGSILDDVMFNNVYVTYDRTGEYENIMTVTDMSGNSTEIPVHIVVVDAPVIEGVKDITVTVGTKDVDYLEGIKATGSDGADITSLVTCDAGRVDLNKEGAYTVTYAVVDENGFEAVKSAVITVQKEEEKTAGTSKKTNAGKNNVPATGNNGKKSSAADTIDSTKNASSGKTEGNVGRDTGKGNSSGGQTSEPSPLKPDTEKGNSSSGGEVSDSTPSRPDTGNSGNGNSNSGGQAAEPTPPIPDTGSGGNGQVSDENQQRQDQIENGGFEDFDPSSNQPRDDEIGGGDVTWN